MYNFKKLLLFLTTFTCVSAYAQSLIVTGKVVDSEGYEVIGSSVTVKGLTGTGTVTDINGNFTLKINDASKDILVFSYVGMITQEVKVNKQRVINVTLQANTVMLDEVVAIGYATVKRKDLTVIKSVTQLTIGNLFGRSVRLDIYANDAEGKQYDIEVQQNDSGAVPERARLNSSLFDARLTKLQEKHIQRCRRHILYL